MMAITEWTFFQDKLISHRRLEDFENIKDKEQFNQMKSETIGWYSRWLKVRKCGFYHFPSLASDIFIKVTYPKISSYSRDIGIPT